MLRLMAVVLCLPWMDETHLPLGKGAKWTYGTDYDPDTDIIHEVTGTEKVGDVECFVVEHRSEFNVGKPDERIRILRKEWLARGEGGVRIHQVQRGSSVMEVPVPFFKLKEPLKKGDEWKGEAKASTNSPTYHVVVEDREDVEVPAGKYKAWKLMFKIESGTRHRAEGFEWYAPGVGIVKIDMTISASGETFPLVSELKKYQPGK